MILGTSNILTLPMDTELLRAVAPAQKEKDTFADIASLDTKQPEAVETSAPRTEEKTSENTEKQDNPAKLALIPDAPAAFNLTPILNPIVAVELNAKSADTTAQPQATTPNILPAAVAVLNNNVSVLNGSAKSPIADKLNADIGNTGAADQVLPAEIQNILNKNISAAPAANKPMAKAGSKSADILTNTPATNSPLPQDPSSPQDAAGVLSSDDGAARLTRQPAGEKDALAFNLHHKNATPSAADTANAAPLPNLTPAPAPAQQPVNYIDPKNAPIAVMHQPVAEQVAVQIVKSVKDGADKIKIQLSPEDLGRVEIRLEIQKDAHIKAVIAADKPETAEWLQRDAKQLERALQDAGFKTDNNSFEFQNRDQSQQNFANPYFDRNTNEHAAHKYYNGRHNSADLDIDNNVLVKNLYVRDGGVNIMV